MKEKYLKGLETSINYRRPKSAEKIEETFADIYKRIWGYIPFIITTLIFHFNLFFFPASVTSIMEISSISMEKNLLKIKTWIGKLKGYILPWNKQRLKYWVGQKIHSGFSGRLYRKTQTNILRFGQLST